MTNEMIAIGGKQVLTFPPYTPTLEDDDGMIGRNEQLELVLAAWIAQPGFSPMNPLLVGEPGVGKNRLVYELAQCTRKELYVFQGHEDVTPEDLVCAVRFSDDAAKKIDYVLSPLATAIRRGGICFIDEIGKLRPRALAPLASLLDDRRYVDSNTLGERIDADPGFRFIAATNTADLAQNGLPEFMKSRQRLVIALDYPSRDEIGRIVRGRFRRICEDNAALIDRFWRLWSETRGDEPVSPRDALNLFGLALNLADAQAAGGRRVEQSGQPAPFATPEVEHLERAFRHLFLEPKFASGGER